MKYWSIPIILTIVMVVSIIVVLVRSKKKIGYSPSDIQTRLDAKSRCIR